MIRKFEIVLMLIVQVTQQLRKKIKLIFIYKKFWFNYLLVMCRSIIIEALSARNCQVDLCFRIMDLTVPCTRCFNYLVHNLQTI